MGGIEQVMYNKTLSVHVIAQCSMHTNHPLKALRSRGTLLPLPARYLRSPPVRGLGLGNRLSPWNLKRASSIRTGPFAERLCEMGAGDAPPLVSVYALGSSVEGTSCERGREGTGDGRDGGSITGGAGAEAGGGGGGAAGAAEGGGGGGAEGELVVWLKAVRAA